MECYSDPLAFVGIYASSSFMKYIDSYPWALHIVHLVMLSIGLLCVCLRLNRGVWLCKLRMKGSLVRGRKKS